MRKTLTLIFAFIFLAVSFMYAADATLSKAKNNSAQSSLFSRDRVETVVYQETFETGMNGWTSSDGTLPLNNWHLDSWNAYGGTGYTWWMGDPGNHGYYNHQYLVMDTPALTVPANGHLTFKLKYNMETTAGATAPYNGWDGCNVRISTNNGATWTVISGTPAYNSTSLYSFGEEHGEGPNIAGWGGSIANWADADFNLSTYAGQSVKIRFAFASDPASATDDDPARFGMMVDNIAITGSDFNYDFNDNNTHGITVSSMVPIGGDLWHIAEDTTAPSPNHAVACQNDAGSYNTSMLNYLNSPFITMPGGGDIRADFWLKGSWTDPDQDNPDATTTMLDYFGFEVSPDSGATWFAMSNPYGDAADTNFVYISAGEEWLNADDSYTGLDGYISDYHGLPLLFRVYFSSDADAPNGWGLFVDDFTIYHQQYLPEPTDLTATLNQTNVNLAWTAPQTGGQTGWINWDSGENSDSIGLTGGGNFDVSAYFSAEDMTPYSGGTITKIKFFPNSETSTYTLKIWGGPAGATVLHSQAVTTFTNAAWNEITLTTPVAIEMGQQYYIGYNTVHPATQYPAGIDAGPHVVGKGDMIRMGGGAWGSVYDASTGAIDGNWNIQAEVTAAGRTFPVFAGSNTVRVDRQLTGFKVHHSTTMGTGYTMLAELPATTTTYTHTNASTGRNYYVVTATYDNGESGYSNEAMAFVLGAGFLELTKDDGTSEQAFTMTSGGFIATKYEEPLDSLKLTNVKVYIAQKMSASLSIKVWDNTGTNGLPGATFVASLSIPNAQLVEGWNIFDLPATNQPLFEDGDFYIGIQSSATSNKIGLDTSNAEATYQKVGTQAWAPFATGDIMVRAIVQKLSVGNEGYEELAPVKFATSNYPNPFNPSTTIQFSVPSEGKVKVKVYNTKGQLINTLANDTFKAGTHRVNWNGMDSNGKTVASGLYFYKVETNTKTITSKMLLMK